MFGEAKFVKFSGGLMHFAEVAVCIEKSDTSSIIKFDCSGKGFYSQGHVEDATAEGYDDWKAGGKAGALFALSFLPASHLRVVVTRISGLTSDTTPAAVGAATALAIWNALKFVPTTEAVSRLETVVLQSSIDDVPNFSA
ncbi:MAG TPA: hypothetical protein VEK08_25515 [Planctomycetota bacterium]|nr:hypothetical protein [Planctomycetota bacterium]